MKLFYLAKHCLWFTFLVLAVTLIFPAGAKANLFAKNHEKLMKDDDYGKAYEQFSATLQEAKSRLDQDDYNRVEEECKKTISEEVSPGQTSDYDEADSYATAYWMCSSQINNELGWDWLRRNAHGVIGYYRLKSESLNGYLTIEASDEAASYAVYIFAAKRDDPEDNIELKGLGRLEGDKMKVEDIADDNMALELNFNGETANLKYLAEGKPPSDDDDNSASDLVLEGTYLREKK